MVLLGQVNLFIRSVSEDLEIIAFWSMTICLLYNIDRIGAHNHFYKHKDPSPATKLF